MSVLWCQFCFKNPSCCSFKVINWLVHLEFEIGIYIFYYVRSLHNSWVAGNPVSRRCGGPFSPPACPPLCPCYTCICNRSKHKIWLFDSLSPLTPFVRLQHFSIELKSDNEKLLIMAKFSLNCVQQKLFNKWDLVQTEFQQNGGKASLMDSKYIKLLLSLQDHA